MRLILPVLVGVLLVAGYGAHGQTARLTQHSTGSVEIKAAPGDTLLIDVRADLGRHRATGVTIFLQISSDGLRVLEDVSLGGPFVPGGLFADGVIVRNELVSDSHSAVPEGHRLLQFTTLVGPSAGPRGHGGGGSIACFRVLCERAISGTIRLHHSPVFESRIVLADGRTERSLLLAPPIQIDVDEQTLVRPVAWGHVKAHGNLLLPR